MEPARPPKIRSHDLLPFIYPKSYHLRVIPSDDFLTLSGTIFIELKLEQPSDIIRLHNLEVKVLASRINISPPNGNPTALSSILISAGLGETTEIQFPSQIPSNVDKSSTVTLEVDFESLIRSGESKDALHGLYSLNHPSSPYHTLSKGFCTQFEPCYARRAFPCFDEPSLRCPWSLDLILPAGCDSQALFNTDPSSIHTDDVSWPKDLLLLYQDGRRLFRFPKTCPISSYLVAICVGSFDSISKTVNMKIDEKDAGKPLLIRCFGPSGRGAELNYALELAGRAVMYFCDQLKIDLPMEKMDLVGVPLSGLGMENHSLLTFQWEHFLVSDATPFPRRQRITRLIFHEVAHQWFGNLVTIEWWSYLYLKEGLARFLEYHLIEAFFPEWNYWQNFQDEIFAAAMEKDERMKRTHAIEVPLGDNARQYSTIFDVISYGKAACVLRSVCNFAGIGLWPAFKRFVHQNKFGAVNTLDLWRSIGEETGQPQLVQWLDSWIKRAGHPILALSLSDDGTVSYEQRPTQVVSQDPFEPFPIFSVARIYNLSTREAKMQHIVVNDIRGKVPDLILKPDEVLIFNSGHVGFFRTSLDDKLLDRLLQAATHPPAWFQDEIDNLLFDYSPLAVDNPQLFPFDQIITLTTHASLSRPHFRKLAFLRDNLLRFLLTSFDDPKKYSSAKNFALTKLEAVLPMEAVLGLLPSPLTLTINEIPFIELLMIHAEYSESLNPKLIPLVAQICALDSAGFAPNMRMLLGRFRNSVSKKNMGDAMNESEVTSLLQMARENSKSNLASVKRQARLTILTLSGDQVEIDGMVSSLKATALTKLTLGFLLRKSEGHSLPTKLVSFLLPATH